MYWVFHEDDLFRALADYQVEGTDAEGEKPPKPPTSAEMAETLLCRFGDERAPAKTIDIIRFLTSHAARRQGLVYIEGKPIDPPEEG